MKRHFEGCSVQVQRGDGDSLIGIFRVLGSAPQNGMDAGDKFFGIERLRKVIIGPKFKSKDAVKVLTPCGEHDDRDGEILPQSAQERRSR